MATPLLWDRTLGLVPPIQEVFGGHRGLTADLAGTGRRSGSVRAGAARIGLAADQTLFGVLMPA